MKDNRVAAQVARWRDELIDLTRRNRLLNFKTNKASALEITAPSAPEIIRGLDSPTGWRFHYPPQEEVLGDDVVLRALETEDPDLTDDLKHDELLTNVSKATDLSRMLHNMERRASQEYLDKGLRVLYLGVGALEWIDGDGQALVSPLVLVPVALERPNPRAPFRLRTTDEDPVTNPALAVKLDREFELQIPEVDVDDLEIGAYLRSVVSSLGTWGKKWTVTDRVVLSVFSFHKESMYRDLLANEEAVCEHSIVEALALGPGADKADFSFDLIPDDHIDEVAKPEDLASILDADSTQRQCIAAARDGRTFVMDGPPGSGKSQTIANAIAELIYNGKTVLFVSEKAAALEVVKSRLDDCDLGHFVLELHSHKATRKEVAVELSRALNLRPRAKSPMTPADRQQVERRRQMLSAYAAALNEVRPTLGMSLFDAIGRGVALQGAPVVPRPQGVGADLTLGDFSKVLDVARSLGDAWGPVARGNAFLWRDLADGPAAVGRTAEIDLHLSSARDALQDLQAWGETASLALGLDPPNRRSDSEKLLALLVHLRDRPAVPEHWLLRYEQRVDDRIAALENMAMRRNACVESLATRSERWIELDPCLASVLSTTLDGLNATTPPVEISLQLSVEQLRETYRYVTEARSVLMGCSVQCRELAAMFGAPLGADAFLADLRHVASLAGLASAANRPDPEWFTAGRADAVRVASEVLRPLVEEFRCLDSQLAEHFTAALVELDLDAIYPDEHTASPNISRLSWSGWRNRRNLKACTKAQRITAETIKLIPAIRAWSRLRATLASAEVKYAPTLGAYYKDRDQVDFDRISDALSIATLTCLGSLYHSIIESRPRSAGLSSGRSPS